MTPTNIDRHPPIGLFNFAASYRTAPDLLAKQVIKATHPNAPISFLYYQAIELYLKAFLRLSKVSMKKLRRIGHDYIQLGVIAQSKGLVLNSKDLAILQVLGEGDAWARARYLEVGMLAAPDTEELARTCARLNKSIDQAMTSAALPVREARASTAHSKLQRPRRVH
jgi:hypothetical protein